MLLSAHIVCLGPCVYINAVYLLQLFYMVKGDMCLKVVEKGVHKDIPIREGEVIW